MRPSPHPFLSSAIPAVLVLAFALAAQPVQAQSQPRVDFRYEPPIWHTPIGLPGDWHKPLVDQNGALIYDFGPGPYARAATFVSVGLEFDDDPIATQSIADPRVPIIEIESRFGRDVLQTHAFSVVPRNDWDAINSKPYDGSVRRLNGVNSAVAWADPVGVVDPAFRNVAYGSNRPIEYQIKVSPGARKRVALGFADPYRTPGHNVTRIMLLTVEGADEATIDPANDLGKNVAGARMFDASDDDRDGWLSVVIKADPTTVDGNLFLSVIWVFAEGTPVDEHALIRGDLSSTAERYIDCGRDDQLKAFGGRTDVLYAARESGEAALVVNIKSRRDLAYDAATGTLTSFGESFIAIHPRPDDAEQTADGWQVAMAPSVARVAVSVLSGAIPIGSSSAINPPEAEGEMARVRDFWVNKSGLPWNRISVPDDGIQAVFDGSIRVMYQLLERIDGDLQSQPGPSVYRGLWASNQPRVGRALTHLGATDVARSSLAKTFSHQGDDGRILILTPPILLKETGLSMHAVHLHARMTRDRAFLEHYWPTLQRAADWIVRTSRITRDSSAVNFGLMPAGMSDGGVGGVVPEFTTNYWNLLALRNMADGAVWLGRLDEAARYEQQFATYNTSFRRAAARALSQDPSGNWFLPIRMEFDEEKHVPQRSQTQFSHIVYPGRLFAKDDPLVMGNTAMLRDAPKAEGLGLTTGWLAGGVQPFIEATEASMWLYLGEVTTAQDRLYAVANHAAPTHVWVEEQLPGTGPRRSTGDVPHSSGSAEYINLVRYMVAMEDGKHLELLKGVPSHWWQEGAVLQANDVPTEFGNLTLRVKVSDDTRHVDIEVQPVDGPTGEWATGGVSIHLGSFAELGYALSGVSDALDDASDDAVGDTTADGTSRIPDTWTAAWGTPVKLRLER